MKGKSVTILFFIIIISLVFLNGCSKDRYSEELVSNNYENLSRLQEYETKEIVRVYQAKAGNVVQLVRISGYEEGMEFIFEIDGESVSNVVLLDENETEDYGGYVKEEWFLKRLYLPIEKEIEVVKMAKEKENQVVAITGATITSERAVIALNLCIENFRRIKK